MAPNCANNSKLMASRYPQWAAASGGGMENKSYSGGKTLLGESFSTSPRGTEGGEESVDVCVCVCVCV